MKKIICEFLFFYSKDTNYDKIFQILEKYPKNTKIITNRSGLNAYLKNENKNSFMIAEQVSETGPVGEDIFETAKKYLKEFEDEIKNKKCLDVSIFEGFEYSLLRKVYLLSQAKKIFEEKENIIFIFENYSPIYFSIIKLAIDLGFSNQEQIGFIVNNRITFFNISEAQNLLQNLSKNRLMNFVKNNGEIGTIKLNLLFLNKILSLLKSKIKFKIKKIFDDDKMKNVLGSLDRKLEKINIDNDIDALFFLTTTRPDLYLTTWYPILKKFKESKKTFLIITSDIITDMILEKEGITHLNIFEEKNLLENQFKNKKDYGLMEFYKKTKLKENFLLGIEPILDDILKDMIKSIAIITLCDFILKKKKPKSVVAMADGEMLECLACAAAKKYNIPTFSSSPTLPNPHPILSKWFHAEKFFIDGTTHADTFLQLGYSKNRILLVGNPKYDLYRNINIKDAKKILEKKYGINKEKKLIIFAMSKWRKDDQIWMTDIIKFCNKENFEIVFKIHPKFKTASNQISEEKIRVIKNSCQNLKFLFTYNIELLELIPASDLIITDFSSVGLEAVIAGKPLLSINLFNENFEFAHDIRVDKYGASLYIDEYQTLEKYIVEILNEGKYVTELNKKQSEIVEKFNYYNDGNAVNRIFKNLISKD